MIIDTHAHLDFPDFQDDLPEVVQRAKEAGVTRIINIGTDLASCEMHRELSARYSGVLFRVVGIHPNSVMDLEEADFEKVRKMSAEPGVAALGETGLDYYRLLPKPDLANSTLSALGASTTNTMEASIQLDSMKAAQAEVFRAHLDLAVELGLNVVIHQREAWEDTLEILADYTGKVRTVFHCFGGSPEQAELVISMGHLVSFTGIVTFKNAKLVHETVASVPKGKFMLETDCPFLAPTPHRGQRCEPSYTRLVAEAVAELRDVSVEELSAETSATAEDFFRFS